jgi:hypothetical protein
MNEHRGGKNVRGCDYGLMVSGCTSHYPGNTLPSPPTNTKFQTFLITWKHVYQLSVIPHSLNSRNFLSWLRIFTIFFSPTIKCPIVDLKTMNEQLYVKESCTTLQCLSNRIPLPRKHPQRWPRFEKKYIYFIQTCVRTRKFKILSLHNSIQSYPCINTGLYHSIKFLLQS